jgi:hypothetical protein
MIGLVLGVRQLLREDIGCILCGDISNAGVIFGNCGRGFEASGRLRGKMLGASFIAVTEALGLKVFKAFLIIPPFSCLAIEADLSFGALTGGMRPEPFASEDEV